MKKKSFLQNFHTLPALCRTFGAGECEKAGNRWKWGGGSDTMRVIIRNNLSGIASQCYLSSIGEALAFCKALSLRQRLPSLGELSSDSETERLIKEDNPMDFNKAALEMHETHHGKVGIVSKVEVKTRDDLSTAYTPGVAEPCRKIRENPDDVYKYTFKGNMVAVVSNGTAVLGLGDIGPEAGLPVMEGKAVLFKEFGGVDAFPICVDTKDVDKLVETIALISKSFGGINLEDIAAPRCFEVERRLKEVCDIPVFHDDQHGTAIVVAAALLNAMRVTGKQMGQMKIVINGAGAAGIAIGKLLISMGFGNIVMCDINGIICEGDEGLNAGQEEISHISNRNHEHGALADALRGADAFVGVSRPNLVTAEMVSTMKDGIVFAMANPTPEIMPDEAKRGGAAVVGTGRSDFPNQINNVMVFPGIFKGTLAVRAREITEGMKIRAARALAALVTDEQLSADYILPSALDKSVADTVARAVAQEAREQGIARA